MTTGIVTFDPIQYRDAHPEFASVSYAALQSCFDEAAALYLDNSEASPVASVERRAVLLDLLVGHLAATCYGVNGQGPSGLMGRVSSATEGSVSVTAELGDLPPAATFFATTPYGLAYWQATAFLRRFRYVPGRSYPAPRIGYLGNRWLVR